MTTTTVNFPTYCNMFDVIGGGQSAQIYHQLDPATLTSTFYSVETLGRGAEGDGRIEVTEQAIRLGQMVTVGRRILTQDGGRIKGCQWSGTNGRPRQS